MNILYLAHRIPYPPNKGDKIRSFNEIKHLSETCEIDLACLADEADDLPFAGNLKAYCRRVAVVPLSKTAARTRGMLSLVMGKSISVGYFYKKNLQKVIDLWITFTPYDAVVCFSSPMAEYVFRSKWYAQNSMLHNTCNQASPNGLGLRQQASTPQDTPANPINSKNLSGDRCHTIFPSLIMDFCDMDSDKWRQYAAKSRFPMNLLYTIEFHRLLRYEKEINTAFDHSIFVSQSEVDLFKKHLPSARNVTVVPNGVDHEYFSPDNPNIPDIGAELNALCSKPPASYPILLFTGAMDYHANVDGVKWFCDEIFPHVQKQLPEVRFFIVGSHPSPQVMDLGKRKGVVVTGFVADIRPYYLVADVCVIPLRMARGVQNKVLEAMAMGKAVVCTAAANRGINANEDFHLLVNDLPIDFVQAVLSLLSDSRKREQIGTNARAFIESHLIWGKNMAKIETFVGKIQ